ncbi:MAG: hypothetical protein STSR0001_04790 [Methanothrix sp.]
MQYRSKHLSLDIRNDRVMAELSIDPRENGVHSLAMALEAFNKLHINPTDIFSLKDSVLRAHHSIETLSKDIVFQINPALLLKDDQKTPLNCLRNGYKNYFGGRYFTVLEECQTIGIEKNLDLLKELGLIGIEDSDFKSYKESIHQLVIFRNRAQHLGLSADPERVKRILGNTIPQSIEILQEAYDELSDRCPDHNSFRYRTIKIKDYLKRNWPDSLTWLDILKKEYCDLVQRAIAFFREVEFLNQPLDIGIKDYGKVGVPPYYPEIKLSGFLNQNYDLSAIIKLKTSEEFAWKVEEELIEIGWPYNIKLLIDQPKIEESTDMHGKSIVKGKLCLRGYVKCERLENVLIISGAEKEIATLRDAVIAISAKIEYVMEANVDSHHLSSESIKNARGQLNIDLTAFAKGYEEAETAEINGKYTVDLDETNTSFRLNTFMKPDGKTPDLDGNYTLEWTINALGHLRFK